jgi:hypothetical protein
MTRERDGRMWSLAHRLAKLGEYQNCQAIEWELRAFGYPQAPQLLCREQVRERLDSICAEARKGFVGIIDRSSLSLGRLKLTILDEQLKRGSGTNDNSRSYACCQMR